MPALALQFAQVLLLQLCGRNGLRLHHLSKFAQHLCIDAIGLSQNSCRSCKLPHPVGLYQTDFYSPSRKRLDKFALVTTTRFTNYLHSLTELFHPLDQLSMSKALISKTAVLASNCCI